MSKTIEDKEETNYYQTEIIKIPSFIKPDLKEHRIEVLFWGVRNLGKVNFFRINRPRVSIICQNDTLNSDVISNARANSNFSNPIKSMNVVKYSFKSPDRRT